MKLKKVLIIDTSKIFQALLKRDFIFMEVFYSNNLQESIEIAKSQKVDLIVVSGFSIEASGFSIAKKIRNTDDIQYIPIIMMSSNIDDETVKNAYEAGVNSFISKDNFVEDLKRVIDSFETQGTQIYHKNLLFVSTHIYIYNALKAGLSKYGINLDLSTTFDESVIIHALKENYNYILIDDLEKQPASLEIAKLFIKANLGQLLVLTAKDTPNRKNEFTKLGIDDFYDKPFICNDFVTYLLTLFTKKSIKVDKTILVVDDSKLYRKIISNILEGIGIKVVKAVDGDDGINKLQENHIDLIITDLYMPKIDGERFIKLAKQIEGKKDIPIIVTTSAEKKEKIFTCFELGAVDFISKPFSESEIIARIKRFLM
jgi:two-component system, chemotaxis family, chemotaxis protein CheY